MLEKKQENAVDEKVAKKSADKLRVICGANTQELEGMLGYTVREVRQNLREVMSIGDGHTVVLVNGKELADEGVFLDGNEELEFKKPAGQKGL